MERTSIQTGRLREKIDAMERAIREAEKGIDRTVRAGFRAESVLGFLMLFATCATQELYLWWLGCRKDGLEGRLYDARRRAAWEEHADLVQGHEAELESRRRVREAVLDLRGKYGDRPARICGREPQTAEELRLVEDFLSGAEERHRRCLEAWRRSDYDDAVRERVREDLEKDLPLRRYERRNG